MNIYDNFINVKKEIERKAVEVGRAPSDIEVIAVSKTFPAPVVQQAIDSGIRLLGENSFRRQRARSRS